MSTFNYRISCSNGAFFSGVKHARKHGAFWTTRAVFPLHVSRTRTIACTLQEMKAHTDP